MWERRCRSTILKRFERKLALKKGNDGIRWRENFWVIIIPSYEQVENRSNACLAGVKRVFSVVSRLHTVVDSDKSILCGGVYRGKSNTYSLTSDFRSWLSSCRAKERLKLIPYAKSLDLSKGSWLLFFVRHERPLALRRQSKWIRTLITIQGEYLKSFLRHFH